MGQSKVTFMMVEALIKDKQFSRVSPKTTAENAAYAKALDAVWPLAVCYYDAIGA